MARNPGIKVPGKTTTQKAVEKSKAREQAIVKERQEMMNPAITSRQEPYYYVVTKKGTQVLPNPSYPRGQDPITIDTTSPTLGYGVESEKYKQSMYYDEYQQRERREQIIRNPITSMVYPEPKVIRIDRKQYSTPEEKVYYRIPQPQRFPTRETTSPLVSMTPPTTDSTGAVELIATGAYRDAQRLSSWANEKRIVAQESGRLRSVEAYSLIGVGSGFIQATASTALLGRDIVRGGIAFTTKPTVSLTYGMLKSKDVGISLTKPATYTTAVIGTAKEFKSDPATFIGKQLFYVTATKPIFIAAKPAVNYFVSPVKKKLRSAIDRTFKEEYYTMGVELPTRRNAPVRTVYGGVSSKSGRYSEVFRQEYARKGTKYVLVGQERSIIRRGLLSDKKYTLKGIDENPLRLITTSKTKTVGTKKLRINMPSEGSKPAVDVMFQTRRYSRNVKTPERPKVSQDVKVVGRQRGIQRLSVTTKLRPTEYGDIIKFEGIKASRLTRPEQPININTRTVDYRKVRLASGKGKKATKEIYFGTPEKTYIAINDVSGTRTITPYTQSFRPYRRYKGTEEGRYLIKTKPVSVKNNALSAYTKKLSRSGKAQASIGGGTELEIPTTNIKRPGSGGTYNGIPLTPPRVGIIPARTDYLGVLGGINVNLSTSNGGIITGKTPGISGRFYPGNNTRIIRPPVIVPNYTPIIDNKPGVRTRPRQGFVPLLRTVPGLVPVTEPTPFIPLIRPPPPPIPPPETPTIPLALGSFVKQQRRYVSGAKRKGYRPRVKYTPSVEAILLNIRGGKVSDTGGLGLRPMRS